MNFNEDDLDAFLWEVETVSKQVNDILEGKVDIHKLEEKERIKRERKEKEEIARQLKIEMKKKEEEEIKRKGKPGKGNTDNYIRICKKCFVEFEIDCENCYHCNNKTMTKEERQRELKQKVEEYKEKKAKKMHKKTQFENWRKTELIMKKTGFSHYRKWEMYESSSDEENKEPILPRNDPNFIALEKDLMESQKERELCRKNALKLKEEANKAMSEQRYRKSIRLYTEAIEQCKSIMSIYTNRALAYLRVREFDNCIKDCDKVIEYLEIFEDQLILNKDLYAKALSRKAISLSCLKNYTESIELLNQALDNYKDKEIEKTLENIKAEQNVHLDAIKLINSECSKEQRQVFNELDKFINNVFEIKNENLKFDNYKKNFDDFNINKISVILTSDEKFKLYFIEKGGLENIFLHLKKCLQFLSIIKIFNTADKYKLIINSMNGYQRLIRLLFDLGENEQTVLDIPQIKLIVQILEDSTQNESVRKSLVELKKFDQLFLASIKRFDITKKEIINNGDYVIILMNFFTFLTNVCYSSDLIKKSLTLQFDKIMEVLKAFISIVDESNTFHMNLFDSIISFLINLSCEITFREKLKGESEFILFLLKILKEKIYDKTKLKDTLERGLSLLINLSYDDSLNNFYVENGICEFLIKNITKNSFKIVNLKNENEKELMLLRLVMMISKITKKNSHKFIFEAEFYSNLLNFSSLDYYNQNSVITDNIIKIFAHTFTSQNFQGNDLELKQKTKNQFNTINIPGLIKNISNIFTIDTKIENKTFYERIVNTLSLAISIVNQFEDFSENFRDIVPILINIAKDKVDLTRKNSAILLAKLAKNQNLYSYITELHGIEVIMNVAKFLNLDPKK